MEKVQFRVLYREFLFCLIDREVLSAHAQGDANKLLGQFAAILIVLSLVFTLVVLAATNTQGSHEALLIAAWSAEHALIATTMLVVGLFAVLSWNSAFPDRRDVMVLRPLPVRTSTILLAKIASMAAALGITVLLFNALPSFVLALALAPATGGFLNTILSADFFRMLAAYWITVAAAGALIFCGVLAVQGIAAQLPRRVFLRLSALLQLSAFCLFVSVYFLQPALATPAGLQSRHSQHLLAWLPSYWFLGLLQQLNGSTDRATYSALTALAERAWLGSALAVAGAGSAFLLAYWQTLRRIAEAPDITPGAHRFIRLPRFGNSLETAVVQFSIRTLLRSRQHRVIAAFYTGIAFGILVLLLRTPFLQQFAARSKGQLPQGSLPLIASSFVVMCLWLLGMRVVFAMPLDLGANWIFRLAPLRRPAECLRATRRAMYVLGPLPVWAGCGIFFFGLWPWRAAAEHMAVLGLTGVALAELCLHSFHKLPFTCSFLPGRSNLHITFCLCLMLGFNAIVWAGELERRALADPAKTVFMFLVLSGAAIWARWRTSLLAASNETSLQFEEEQAPAVLGLNLHRDGVLTIEAPVPPARIV